MVLWCLSLPQVEPFLPFEFSCEGMLERLHAYIHNQVGLCLDLGTRGWVGVSVCL